LHFVCRDRRERAARLAEFPGFSGFSARLVLRGGGPAATKPSLGRKRNGGHLDIEK
jgi:hypothetical protein